MRRLELPDQWEERPGLRRHIGELVLDGRRRTAMDEVLRLLRHDGESTELLYLALMLANQGRTAQLRSPEPLTDQQIRSALLAPIATECSACGNFWYSPHIFLTGRQGVRQNYLDPIGAQCQVCRYTACRECLPRRSRNQDVDEVIVAHQHCPAYDCPGVLAHPVLPTGRHDVMSISPDRIECIIVMRDGIIPPAIGEAMPVVTRILPLIADDTPLVDIRRGGPSLMRDDPARDELALSHIRVMERDGLLKPGARARSTRLFVPASHTNDDDHLITVVARQEHTSPA